MRSEQGKLTAEHFEGRNLDPRGLRADAKEKRGAAVLQVIRQGLGHSRNTGRIRDEILTAFEGDERF